MHFEKKSPEVPEQLNAVLEINKPIKKNPPCVISPQDGNMILDHDNSYGSGEFKRSTD